MQQGSLFLFVLGCIFLKAWAAPSGLATATVGRMGPMWAHPTKPWQIIGESSNQHLKQIRNPWVEMTAVATSTFPSVSGDISPLACSLIAVLVMVLISWSIKMFRSHHFFNRAVQYSQMQNYHNVVGCGVADQKEAGFWQMMSVSISPEDTETSSCGTQSAQRVASSPFDVLEFWFGGDYGTNHRGKWFASDGSTLQSETDQRIHDEFATLLQQAEDDKLQDWKSSPASYLALIILLDQFSRHFYRRHPDRDTKVSACDHLAVQYAEEFAELGWSYLLPLEQRIFSLMPLRHSPTPERMRKVLQEINHLSQYHSDMDTMLDKFKRATIRRMHHMEGSGYVDRDDILEFHPFQADESDITKTKLYQSMEEFLKTHNALQCKALCVSLSGGVDSMVIAKLLTVVQRQSAGFQILALHVDYTNRSESAAEARFVQQWCEEHGIIFRQRVISEYKRRTTPREVYERVTRDIRFQFYGDEIQKADAPAVIFGHHQGDLQENVICNLMRRSQLLDIAGMKPVDIVQGVEIWRPLLAHPKSDIFDFAHKYGVPYLKDTTARWSTRGSMRNNLMPLLQDMFGSGYLDNLSSLAKQSADMAALVSSDILHPVQEKLNHTPLAVWLDCSEYVERPLVFWKVVLKHIGEKVLGIGLIAEGPIQSFMMRLRVAAAHSDDPNRRNGHVDLKKGQHFYLAGTKLIYLRPGFIPVTPCYQDGELLDKNTREIARGPYSIHIECVNVPEEVAERRLTIADVLSGHFCYYLPFGLQLVFDKDRKLRPEAFRGIPRALTDVMPIVCLKPRTGMVEDDVYYKITITGTLQ